MLVGGKSLDLVKLFFNVKKKGGYKKVSENGLWDFVATECGFDLSDGLALKLVYADNLELILKALKNIFEERKVKSSVVKIEEHRVSNSNGDGDCLMDIRSNLESFLSEIKMNRDTNYMKMDRDLVNTENYDTRCVPNYVNDLEEEEEEKEGIPNVNDSGVCSMDLSSNLEPFLSDVSNIKKKDAIYSKVDPEKCDSDNVCVVKLPEEGFRHFPVKSNGDIKNENIENYQTRCVPNYVIDLEEEGVPNVNASGVCSMELSSDLEPFLSQASNIKTKKYAIYEKSDSNKFDTDDVCGSEQVCSNLESFSSEVSIYTKVDSDNVHDLVKSNGHIKNDLTKTVEKFSELNPSHDPMISNGDTKNYHMKSVLVPGHVSVDLKPIKSADLGIKNVSVINKRSDCSVINEDVCCLKRKRESAIGILDWIYRVARDPCNPAIQSLPEFSEWKDYPNDNIWKQVLFIHEAMLMKRSGYSNDQQFIVQKRQRMHPTMYDEHEKFRHSPRIINSTKKPESKTISKSCLENPGKNPESKIKLPDYLLKKRHQKGVNLGQEYQADVHEWAEKKASSMYEADSKWLGTPMWELGKTQKQQNNKLIELERIGKGRSDSCGCRSSGSIECVRFHVSEKSKRLKLELGIAFYLWRFNQMGEESSVTWTKKEEKKFHDTWKLNPILSLGGFLDETIKALPYKSRASLVNYYFNVFILRRRGEQNRTLPYNITSDDDDDDGDDSDDDAISKNVKPKTLDSAKKTRLKKSK